MLTCYASHASQGHSMVMPRDDIINQGQCQRRHNGRAPKGLSWPVRLTMLAMAMADIMDVPGHGPT